MQATLAKLMRARGSLRISAASWYEMGMVVDQKLAPEDRDQFDLLLADLDVEIVAFDREQALLAREAYSRFGKNSGHPARLNFGDCMTYALAKATGEPLLFKGDDFSQTDLPSA